MPKSPSVEGSTYEATIAFCDPKKPLKCRCDGCSWTGLTTALKEIGDCYLTPGDPSPAGRCPKCESVAYIDHANPDSEFDVSLDGGVTFTPVTESIIVRYKTVGPLNEKADLHIVSTKESLSLNLYEQGKTSSNFILASDVSSIEDIATHLRQ